MKKPLNDIGPEKYEEINFKNLDLIDNLYITRMDNYFTKLFIRFPEHLDSDVTENIKSFDPETAYLAQLAHNYDDHDINAMLIRDVIIREYKFCITDKKFESIRNASYFTANVFEWCADYLEEIKPTEKNYNPESVNYSPITPIIISEDAINETTIFFKDLKNNPLIQGAKVAFDQVRKLAKQASNKIKDASIENLADAFKGLIEKICSVINFIKNFLKEIKDELVNLAKIGVNSLKLANAFYCGISNGLISLLQCILYTLQVLLQPNKTLSYEQYKNKRYLLKEAENLLDLTLINIPEFLKGVKNLLSSSSGISYFDFKYICGKMRRYWNKASNYTIAFYIGKIFFESLINIFIFTENTGNIIKKNHSQKTVDLLKLITKKAIFDIKYLSADLMVLFSEFIIRFNKACAMGFNEFIKFIEEFLNEFKINTSFC